MRAATCGVIEGSNAITLGATIGVGIAGRDHARADAEVGPTLFGGGRAAAALPDTQPATSGPVPTVTVSVGSVPSASAAAGSGVWVETSAATGSAPSITKLTARAGTIRLPMRRIGLAGHTCWSSGATNCTRAKRSAQAATRLPRMAVLVQYSSEVGP